MTAKQRNGIKLFAALALCAALFALACAFPLYGMRGGGTAQTHTDAYGAGGDKSGAFELFSVSNAFSTVEYGTYVAADHTPTPAPKDAATGSVTGVKVSLAQGDWLKYNKVIDLSDCVEQTEAANQLLSLCITPDVIGSLDAETIDVFFTDAYDPTNYFQVNVFNSQDGIRATNAYIKGRATGQQLTGREWNYDKKHVENIYGFPVRLSFAGLFANYTDVLKTISDNSINISVNYAEREIHSAIRKASATSSVVCDLDSGEDFTKLWNGFTTGECFMSIRAGNFAKDKANFVITRIDGQEARDLQFTDRGTPRVQVDTGIYAPDALPQAVIGAPYPLFAASCVSPYDGKLDVNVRVEFGAQSIAVQNNAFVPTEAGEYKVIYEAEDKYGVAGSKTLTVYAPASVAQMEIADCGYPSACFAGEAIRVPTPAVTGGSGVPTVTRSVEYEGKVTAIEGDIFRPTKAGVYTFAFTATDYCGVKAFARHVLTVAAGDKPVFTKDAALPRYFVSGAEYMLPALDAYDYTDGSGNAVKSVISFTDEEGEKNVRSGKITPVARNNGDTVTVAYTAVLAGKSSASVRYDIPTVIVKEGRDVHLERLLYSPDKSVTSVTATSDGASVIASKQATVDFINPVPAHGFDFEFRIPKGGANFGTLTVLLTDAVDPLQQCKFVYRRADGGTEFLTDGIAAANRVSQTFGSADTFRFGYNALRNEVSFDPESKVVVSPVRTVSGEPFTGFDSGKVYLTIVLGAVTNTSELVVASVGGQYITDDTIDFMAPKVAVLGDAGGSHRHGSTVTLPKAVACDCVDYTVTFTLSVTDPDGMPVTATDGTLLKNVTDCGKDYAIVLSKTGSYSVLYTAEDLSGNSTDIGSYKIGVVDVGKPVITVNGKVPETGSVGKQIVVPEASATDDMSVVAVKIYVITARGQIFELSDRAFTPKSAGKYVIRYWCIDEAGNMQTADYAVTVR